MTSTGNPEDLDAWSDFSPEPPYVRPRTWALPEYLALGFGLMVLIGLALLWPSGSAGQAAADELSVLGIPSELSEAVVSTSSVLTCDGVSDLECMRVEFVISTGPDSGSTYTQELPLLASTPDFSDGQKVVLSRVPPNAVVASVLPHPCDFDPSADCSTVTLRLVEPLDGRRMVNYEAFPGQDIGLDQGLDVHVLYEADNTIVGVAPATIQSTYQYADAQRRSYLFFLVLVFVAAVIAFARWRGLAALVGLGLSLTIVVVWLIPSLLDGNSPAWVALVAASAIAYLALYVSHGFTRTSTLALLGILGALALTTLLSTITVHLGSFTGVTSEESTLLLLLDGVDVRGLLLAGIVVGAAGALDDVTVTQASAVSQLRRADSTMQASELFARGMLIGKAHVGSIVNTLMLAYLGAALPLTILFVVSQQSLGTVANSEVVAVEIVRTIVGTLGIIAAVPFTTWLSTIWPEPSPHSH